LEKDVPERVALAEFGILQRRELSRRAHCQVFSLAVFKIRRAPRVFLHRFAHFPIVMVRVANRGHKNSPTNFSLYVDLKNESLSY
jgi:hypothetical protein